MIEPNTKLTPKEKAISYLENKAKKHESADTYDTVDNSFGEDIDKAIDIALEEQARQMIEEIEPIFDLEEYAWLDLELEKEYKAYKQKWLK